MRITVSGAHRTGKTTLIRELVRCLPTYDSIEEPYHQLEEDGHVFAEEPSLADFELQLERSIDTILDSPENCLLDRCPCDMLAYLFTHEDAAEFDVQPWLPKVQDAMQRLDLVVFVPIEAPERVPEATADHGQWRQSVDEQLQSILLEDAWNFGVNSIEVRGAPAVRAQQVLKYLEEKIGHA